ncbi:MAG: hypothetical protein MJ171_05300 [Clostridia bacterium]|nr:hypothetical protein [Clostridia bacterium]
MIVQDNRRLANVKTRKEVGLDFVTQSLEIITPFGKNVLKNLSPFYPGQEEELRAELDKVETLIAFAEKNPSLTERLREVFMEVKDPVRTVEKSGKTVLSQVDLYEVKLLLLQMRAILQITRDHRAGDYRLHCCTGDAKGEENDTTDLSASVPEEYILEDTEEILDILDPRKERMNTFYIYDEFSSSLAELRGRKREIELSIRKTQKEAREELRKKYGIQLTPKFDIVMSRSHKDYELAKSLPELEITSEDYMGVTLVLKPNEEVFRLTSEMENVELQIEEEEERVRADISKKISLFRDPILRNTERIGKLDFSLSKALFSIKHNLVKPEITDEHMVQIVDGRNIQVEEVLKSKGKEYTPVSIELKEGVTVITGANMGGKTISLKLSGQIPVLSQYGFFVPAASAKVGLSNFIQMLIGDSQSVERGLSSFGSEMEELKEILDHAKERSLILIDEIASGTNPSEGTALTKSLVDYLMTKPYISLITTHFETVTERPDVVNMQVTGLSNVDFDRLNREIRNKGRRERINIIAKYMDYRLRRVDEMKMVPKDALNIATMLGLDVEIIEGAKKYIK